MLPAMYPLIYRVLPALADGIASKPKFSRLLGRLVQAFIVVALVVGVVEIFQRGVLLSIGEIFDRYPPWVFLVFAGLVAIGILALLAHVVGWIVGFWLDPVDRKIAMYTWGESETQMLGCGITFLIGLGLAVLYGLVRFVKWAWSG
jgi:hypothetical protein